MVAYAKTFSTETEGDGPIFRPPPKEEPEVRAFQIKKKDVEAYGPTEGCPGCRALMGPGHFRAKHSEECRRRMHEELNKSDSGKARVRRPDERITTAIVKESEIENVVDDGCARM